VYVVIDVVVDVVVVDVVIVLENLRFSGREKINEKLKDPRIAHQPVSNKIVSNKNFGARFEQNRSNKNFGARA
jgi:hypothetical protein